MHLKLLALGISVFAWCSTGSAQSILRSFSGESLVEYFGYSVSDAGDVNNDGFPDVIIGAYYADGSAVDTGSATIYSGLDGSIIWRFFGHDEDNARGASVSGVGDLNGDGYADVIVGAPFGHAEVIRHDVGPGLATVYSGQDGSEIFDIEGDVIADTFGWSVSGAGDVNNDGTPDFIVGAPHNDLSGTDAGMVRVFSGADGSLLYTFLGTNANDQFGYSVSGAGDVNQDGFADVIVGAYRAAPNGANSGSATIFSGIDGSVLYTFNGSAAGDNLGSSVSDAGDVNNDTYPDVIVGAAGANPHGLDSGAAFVFSGQDGSILHTLEGSAAFDLFGVCVSGAGDINLDGHADVIVGAMQTAMGKMGYAKVFSGQDGSVLMSMNGDSVQGFFGYAVSSAGDIDNDGFPDVIVGAYADNGVFTNAGSATIFSGNPCPASWENYGTGWPGTSGVPDLALSADPVLCSTVMVNIGNSLGIPTSGALFIGLTEATIPTQFGGTLYLNPLFSIGVPIPVSGASLPVLIPCDAALCGLSVKGQALEFDAGATQGVAFTPAVRLTLGY